MKSFLLLILSLMTGIEASDEVEVTVCKKGRVEFTCKYPETNKNYQVIKVAGPKGPPVQISQNNVWKKTGRYSLYHDTQHKSLRVSIKSIKRRDIGEYKCQFFEQPKSKPAINEIEFEDGGERCPGPFNHTAYTTAKTTITCGHGALKSNLFCKDNDSTCEDILSTEPSRKSNGRFTLTNTAGGFTVSIRNVSLQDAGVYWCGDKSTHRTSTSRVLHTKVQLDVRNIPVLTQYPTIGNSFTHRCNYQEGTDVSALLKFFCKGEDPSKCQPLARSTPPVLNTRFSMTDDRKGSITMKLNEVTTGDSGTYWCGARTKTDSNLFFQKILLNVVLRTTTPSVIPSTSEHSTATSVSSTPSTTAMSQNGSWLTTVIAAAVSVGVLVLVVVLVVVYKRLECSNKSTQGDAPDKEAFYDKIQESSPNSDTGTSMKTVYVTATFPTNPSAFMDFSTVNFQNGSGEVSGNMYSTVDSSQHPTYSTVNHQTRVAEDPFYSTVNHQTRVSEDPFYSTVKQH